MKDESGKRRIKPPTPAKVLAKSLERFTKRITNKWAFESDLNYFNFLQKLSS